MTKFRPNSIQFIAGSVIAAALGLGFAGCADVITYSRDAQREGVKLYRQGNYTDAAGAFQNSVRQNPRNYEGYYYLGVCYERMGQYEQSLAAYKTARQAINLTAEGRLDDTTRSKILAGLASAIAKSDQRDIETDIAQRDAQDHASSEAWFLLAKIYAYRGDADSAIDAYNRAALLEPTDFEIAKDYGLYLERIGQYQRAEVPLRRAYSLNNQDAQVADALRRIGVVPGPSLQKETELAQPIVPKGPIPEVRVPNPTVQAPRD